MAVFRIEKTRDYFEKLETGYMDVIRDSIENRADDVCRAKEELRTTPVYSKKFREEHEEEILLHQAAKNAFDEMGVKKLPKVKE